MSKIYRSVTINGKKCWIRANTEQEYADKVIEHFERGKETTKTELGPYAWNWFNTYVKPNSEVNTVSGHKYSLDAHIIPTLGEMAIEEIAPEGLQIFFNNLDLARTTKVKIRTTLNMILDNAVEDGIIEKNPLSSKRIRITGKESKETPTYSLDQMQYLVRHIPDVKKKTDQMWLAIQALHPLRPEETYGLKWEDIDFEKKTIYIHRAVTYSRSKTVIKETKTKSSVRTIALSEIAVRYLEPGNPDEYVLGGKTPLTYSTVREMRKRVRKDTGFDEEITPKRFRTTVLTDIYDKTKDVKTAQKAAGHSSSEMTLKHYVKGRGNIADDTANVDDIYGSLADDTATELP